MLSLSLSTHDTKTRTHTDTHPCGAGQRAREREREREKRRANKNTLSFLLPVLTRASAIPLTMFSLILHSNKFQLFHPMAGVAPWG
jgi:hypothetical protein